MIKIGNFTLRILLNAQWPVDKLPDDLKVNAFTCALSVLTVNDLHEGFKNLVGNGERLIEVCWTVVTTCLYFSIIYQEICSSQTSDKIGTRQFLVLGKTHWIFQWPDGPILQTKHVLQNAITFNDLIWLFFLYRKSFDWWGSFLNSRTYKEINNSKALI